MDFEDRLRRVRPHGPPPVLRDRIVREASRPRASRFDWLLPIAAALTAAILSTLASRQVERAVASSLEGDKRREQLRTILSDQFGGDAVARTAAEQIVRIEFVESPPIE